MGMRADLAEGDDLALGAPVPGRARVARAALDVEDTLRERLTREVPAQDVRILPHEVRHEPPQR
jgi:DNA-binding protein